MIQPKEGKPGSNRAPQHVWRPSGTLGEGHALSDSRELALCASPLLGAHERVAGLARDTDHLPFCRRRRRDEAVRGRGEDPAVVRVSSLQCGLVKRCGLG